MARVERDMLIVDCRACGGLHEVVGGHYRGGIQMGPAFLCRTEIRYLSEQSGSTRRVTLGLEPVLHVGEERSPK